MSHNSTISADAAWVTLRYLEDISNISGTTAGLTQIIKYSGNSIYDPDITYVGNSAQGISLYSQLYARYICVSSTISVTFINESATSARWVGIIPVTPTNGFATSPSVNQLLSQPYVKYKVLGPVSSNRSMCTIKHTMNYKKMYGLTTGSAGDDNFWAATNTNPGQQWQWYVFFHSNDTNAVNIQYQIRISYKTKFFERVNYQNATG